MSTPHTFDLIIDLDALAHNWQQLRTRLSPATDCGAVVKANAYGLGMEPVVLRLVAEGCNTFYVANLHEALAVKQVLENHIGGFLSQAIIVLSGCAPGDEMAFIEHRLRPVLVSVEMFERWLNALKRAGMRAGALPCVLKLDTGMSRLGLLPQQLQELMASPEKLYAAGVDTVMSHLACADDPESDFNHQQLQCFAIGYKKLQQVLPTIKGSLANSAGILLGSEFHFDRVRPGIGLYGGNPQPGFGEFGHPVAHLHLPVIQARDLPSGGSVGYGATCHFDGPVRLAVIAGGYADGIFRCLSNRGQCWVSDEKGGGWLAPICGRISMDSLVIDVTAIPRESVYEGVRVELFGEHISVNEVASRAGTISYEVLTSLSDRYRRSYRGVLTHRE